MLVDNVKSIVTNLTRCKHFSKSVLWMIWKGIDELIIFVQLERSVLANDFF